MKPVSHFAAFCQSLTQSEDRWEGQRSSSSRGRSALGRKALEDWRSVVLIVARKNGPYLWIVGPWERPDRSPAEWVVDREQVDATVHAAMERSAGAGRPRRAAIQRECERRGIG